MVKIKKHIEIVSSTNGLLSSMGQISRDTACKVLRKHYTTVGISIVNNLADLVALVARQPDLVFLGMDFIYADDSFSVTRPERIWLSEYLSSFGIACTGSSRRAHQLENNKALAKQRVLDAGLMTAQFYVVKLHDQLTKDSIKLPLPVFIKPVDQGGGAGIDSDSVVRNFEQFTAKVQAIRDRYKTDVLVEEYLPGREFSVAILKSQTSPTLGVMPIELIAPADLAGVRILGKKVKSANAERVVEVTDTSMRSAINNLALDIFIALGARDYGRIDIRLDSQGKPNFLEANLIPSLIEGYGSFPKACELNINLAYEPMMLHIAALGLVRQPSEWEESAEISEPLIPVVPSHAVL